MAKPHHPHIRYRKAHVSMTLDPDQVVSLDAIAAARRASRAQLLREAVDLFLAANRTQSPSPPVCHSATRGEEAA